MRLIEFILGAICVVCIALHILLIPGSEILLVLFLSFLSILYFLLGVPIITNQKMKEFFPNISETMENISQDLHIAFSGATGIAISTSIIGLLFKVMHWPGASAMLGFGMLALIVIPIISLVKIKKKKSYVLRGIIIRCLIFVFISSFILFLPKKTYISVMHRENPEFVKAYEEFYDNPENDSLYQNMLNEKRKMEGNDESPIHHIQLDEEQ